MNKVIVASKKAFILFFCACVLLGAGLGFLLSFLEEKQIMTFSFTLSDISFIDLAVILLIVTISGFVSIIIHELGHLVFGLMSGYKFLSFRIGNIMIMKTKKGMKIKRYSIQGTAGQCLLAAPKRFRKNTPVIAYNLGGGIFNIIFALVSGLLAFLVFSDNGVFTSSLFLFSVVNLFFAATNLIPMGNINPVPNDGSNINSIIKNKNDRYYFWLQLKVHEYMARGKRLSEMPSEWFEYPSKEDLNSALSCAVVLNAYSRLLDEKNFEEAKNCIAYINQNSKNLPAYYRNILGVERVFISVILNEGNEYTEMLFNNDIKKFMSKNTSSLVVLRTSYTYEKLINNNRHNARKCREQFNKIAKSYPYKSDLDIEIELIELVDKMA